MAINSSKLLNLALAVASLAVGLVVLELMVRRVQPVNPYEIAPIDPGAPPLSVGHPTRRHGLRPGFVGRFRHPEYNRELVKINRLGFRDSEPPTGPKSVDAVHVTLLGDSLTFGLGVESEETFGELAAVELARRRETPVEVFNTGVSGYGQLHQLAVLQEEHVRQETDVAVVAFYAGNDLDDVFGFHRQGGTTIDLLRHFGAATVRSDRHVGKNVVTIGGQSRKVLTAHPPAEIRFPLQSEWIRSGSKLRFGATLRPDSWDKPGADGVRFEVYAETGEGSFRLFDEHINPSTEPASREWNNREVELDADWAGGAELVFRTSAGADASLAYDWAVWVEPHLVAVGEPGTLEIPGLPSRLLAEPVRDEYWQRVLEAKEKSGVRSFMSRKSSLFRLLERRVEQLAVRVGLVPPRAVFSYQMISSFERELSDRVRAAFAATTAALTEMQTLMHARGGRLVLLLLPAKFQTEPEALREFLSMSGLPEDRIDIEQPHRLLVEFCARAGIETIDMLPPLRQRVDAGERVFFDEGHPNRRGHRLIADHLVAKLENLRQAVEDDAGKQLLRSADQPPQETTRSR